MACQVWLACHGTSEFRRAEQLPEISQALKSRILAPLLNWLKFPSTTLKPFRLMELAQLLRPIATSSSLTWAIIRGPIQIIGITIAVNTTASLLPHTVSSTPTGRSKRWNMTLDYAPKITIIGLPLMTISMWCPTHLLRVTYLLMTHPQDCFLALEAALTR